MAARTNTDGFTLVEVLVSLAIFSLAIIGLNRAASLAVSGSGSMATSVHAGIVADNTVALSRMATLEIGTTRANATSGGQDFSVVLEVSETDVPDFYQIEVRVSEADREQIVATRRAFRADPPERSISVAQDESPNNDDEPEDN